MRSLLFYFQGHCFYVYIQQNWTAYQGASLMYGLSGCIINIINDFHCFHLWFKIERFPTAFVFFFKPCFSPLNVEFCICMTVFERNAAPESKEDLVSLCVTVWTPNHHCHASSVVTCLDGIETGDDVSCFNFKEFVTAVHALSNVRLLNRRRGEAKLSIFATVIVILIENANKKLKMLHLKWYYGIIIVF